MNYESHDFRFLRVNSVERTSGTPNSFTCNFGESRLAKVKQVQIQSASVPFIHQNIDSSNNFFEFWTNSGTYEYNFTLAEGQYTIDALLAAIKTQMDSAASRTYTLTVQADSKIHIECSETFAVHPRGLGHVIGFTSTLVHAISTAQTADDFVNLHGPGMIHIHCKGIGQHKTMISLNDDNPNISSKNGICSFPVDASWGGYVSFKGNELDVMSFVNPIDLTLMTFNIRTDGGKLLEYGDNHNCQIVLKVWFAN